MYSFRDPFREQDITPLFSVGFVVILKFRWSVLGLVYRFVTFDFSYTRRYLFFFELWILNIPFASSVSILYKSLKSAFFVWIVLTFLLGGHVNCCNNFFFNFILGGKIHISSVTQEILSHHGNFITEFRGLIDVKVMIYATFYVLASTYSFPWVQSFQCFFIWSGGAYVYFAKDQYIWRCTYVIRLITVIIIITDFYSPIISAIKQIYKWTEDTTWNK